MDGPLAIYDFEAYIMLSTRLPVWENLTPMWLRSVNLFSDFYWFKNVVKRENMLQFH